MSVDVEEWFHIPTGLDNILPFNQWDTAQQRIQYVLPRILDLFEKNKVRATFFFLGWIAEKHPDLVKKTLEVNGLKTEEIDYFIFHQANKFMLDYLRKKLKIDPAIFYSNLLTTGNTVSSTIPIAIKDCLDNNLIKINDKIMIAGFGVGYSWGATIITI